MCKKNKNNYEKLTFYFRIVWKLLPIHFQRFCMFLCAVAKIEFGFYYIRVIFLPWIKSLKLFLIQSSRVLLNSPPFLYIIEASSNIIIIIEVNQDFWVIIIVFKISLITSLLFEFDLTELKRLAWLSNLTVKRHSSETAMKKNN